MGVLPKKSVYLTKRKMVRKHIKRKNTIRKNIELIKNNDEKLLTLQKENNHAR